MKGWTDGKYVGWLGDDGTLELSLHSKVLLLRENLNRLGVSI